MTAISCNLVPFPQPCGISIMKRIECNKALGPSCLTLASTLLILSHLQNEFGRGLSYTAVSSSGVRRPLTEPQPPGPGVISLTRVWIAGSSPLAVTWNTGAKRSQSGRVSFVARSTVLTELPFVPNRTHTLFNPGCWCARDRAG